MADPISNTNPQVGGVAQNTPTSQSGRAPSATEPRDMSQFIRTYAKDVAQLTNQPAPVIPKPALPADDGVMLPETDASPVNRPDGIAKEFPQEEVTLTKEDSADIFARASSTSQAQPAAFVPPPTQPMPSDELERREAVLARLRAKIASQSAPQAVPQMPPPIAPPAPAYAPPPLPPRPAPAPAAAPVPQPPAPAATYVPPQFVPTFSPFAPPTPQPMAPRPAPQPAPPPLGVVPLDTGQPSPFHSYSTDFANRIDRQQASKFSVLAAQSDAGLRTTTTVSTGKRGGLIPVVLAVLLIVLGAGGLYAAYRFVSTGEKTEITLGVPSLIFADEKMELPGPDYRQDLASAAAQPLVEGNILITYITVASSTPLGLKSAPQPGGALIRLLDLSAPDILLRNVDVSSTVGVVSSGGQTAPFFILRVSSYERTFAGMLAWESRMAADLELFYSPHAEPVPAAVIATTTASTTSSLVAAAPVALSAPQGFTDAIVSNIDVRVLKDGLGRTLVMYGYSDKETLVIARDEAAFATLVARLAATRAE